MFFAKEIEYVESAINENGIHLNPRKINEINESPEPKDLKQLQRFLRGINYYSKFIPFYRLIENDAE